MKVAVPKERREFECCVVAKPDTVKKFVDLGAQVVVERDAGLQANYMDQLYRDAGAEVAGTEAETLSGADVVLKVQSPITSSEGDTDELGLIQKSAVLVGFLAPLDQRSIVDKYAEQGTDRAVRREVPVTRLCRD